MSTQVALDPALVRQAVEVSGATSEREAVEMGLALLIRLRTQSRIRDLRGELPWTGDLDAMRADS